MARSDVLAGGACIAVFSRSIYIGVSIQPEPCQRFHVKLESSLRRRLFAFIITVYVVTGALAVGASYLGTERALRPLAKSQASQRAELEERHIAALLDREVALATKLADDPAIIRWAMCGNEGPKADAALEQLESYRGAFRDRSYFIALANDLSYRVHDEKRGMRRRDDLRRDDPSDRWFFRTLDEVDLVALNVDYNTTLGRTKVWINAIIKGPKGRKLGVTGTGIDISDFLREITSANEAGIQSILVDRNGAITAHENAAHVRHNATVRKDAEKMTVYSLIDDPDQSERLSRLIARLDGGNERDATLALDVEGKRYLAAVRRLEGVGWFNIVLFDTSKLVSVGDFLTPLVIFVVSLVALLLMMRVLLDRMVFAPLTRLTEASRAFASGRRRVPLKTTRRDEIGSLTEAFNRMTSAIADHTDNLERKVEARTSELARTNADLQRSRGQILESIEYAQLIQVSLLPHDEQLDDFFEAWFVLNRPRDIVGGDMYWFRRLGPDLAAIALIDCVGHGVPGALMTMMVKAVLDQVVSESGSNDPGRILGALNRRLRTTLGQDDSSSRGIDSGLEIGLCICDRAAHQVRFAGAGLSLMIVRQGKLERVAGDRQRVGYRRSRADHGYGTVKLEAAAGERYYMTTDGLLDQPGGTSGFGLGRKRFNELLLSVQCARLRDQGERIWAALDAYRNGKPQVDDVAVLGYALPSEREDP